MMSWEAAKQLVATEVAKWPETFALAAFQGLTFRVSLASSYVNDSGVVMLYTEVLRDGKWLSFAKGTAGELQKEIRPAVDSMVAVRERFAVRDAQRIRCDQCEALMVNGVFCHETGCPNTHSRYFVPQDTDTGVWIKQRKCFECGCTVDADDPCCSADSE